MASLLDILPQTLAIIFAACNLPFVVMVAAMPESPTFLVSKGSMEEAHKVSSLFSLLMTLLMLGFPFSGFYNLTLWLVPYTCLWVFSYALVLAPRS